MKRLLTLFVVLSLFLSSCLMIAAQAEEAPALIVSAAEMTLAKGKTAKLSFELENAELPAKGKAVWTSSDSSVVAVSGGSLSGKSNGTATITCALTTADGQELSAACEVTVYTPVSSLALSTKKLELNVGSQSEALTVKIAPAAASYQDVVWTSSDEAVATVSAEGIVTAVKGGTAVITAASAEPGAAAPKSASCQVTVIQPVEGIRFAVSSVEVGKGKKLKLEPELLPEGAAAAKITWSTSDAATVSVAAGTVTGKDGGTATVTASVEGADGAVFSADVKVNVFAPVTAVTLPTKPLTLLANGKSEKLTAGIKPENAACKDVVWSSSDESIATVDAEGNVTGLKAGKCKITATSAEPADPSAKAAPKSATVQVTVLQPVTSLKIDNTQVSIAKGKSLKLAVTAVPEDASNKKLTWSSADSKVATVSNGTVTAKGVGTTVITATAADGSGCAVHCSVTVYQSVTQLKPNNPKAAVTAGETISLRVTVSPADATDKRVSWSSSNTRIATVADNGVVTGVNVGECTVTAAALDGSGKKTTIKVYVEPVVPVDVVTFTRSGYFGIYDEFAVTFKNLTKTKTIKRIDFKLTYTYAGRTYTGNYYYSGGKKLGPGKKAKLGWWDNSHMWLASNFRIYL